MSNVALGQYPIYVVEYAGELIAGPSAALSMMDVYEVLAQLEASAPSQFEKTVREYVDVRDELYAEFDNDPCFVAMLKGAAL
jgi:hypothetical protein